MTNEKVCNFVVFFFSRRPLKEVVFYTLTSIITQFVQASKAKDLCLFSLEERGGLIVNTEKMKANK